MEYYTYIYKDPTRQYQGLDGEPIYVGKGRTNRAYVKHSNKHLNGRLRKLKAQSKEHHIEIINTTNECAAYWLEIVFIKAFGRKDLGEGTLFNHTDGGDGGTVSIALMKRMINDNPMKPGMTTSSSFVKGEPNPYPWTNERKEKARIAKLGSSNPLYGKSEASAHLNSVKASCINCHQMTTVGNITRWHGDKCHHVYLA
jgi:hypothetical protein